MKKDQVPVLEINNLIYSFDTYAGEVQAVRGVSLKLGSGETLGIVGESGSGKSVTAKAVTMLNPAPPGRKKAGDILFEGNDILSLSKKALYLLRAKGIRMIFQDPMTSLNPTMKVGKQIAEGIHKAGIKNKTEAKNIALRMLKLVGITDPAKRYGQYPHEFSGGMRQRAMIALAMAVNPRILIADEPTTALDVTTQAQILKLMKQLQKEFGTSIIIITHDLGVIASIADRVAVMYAGKIVERADVREIFQSPSHPYTQGLLKSIPSSDADKKSNLEPIPGTPPDLFSPPQGCAFAPRCEYSMRICRMHEPPVQTIGSGHSASCWLLHPKAAAASTAFREQESKHE